MKPTVFIHTNNKQMAGAIVSRYSLRRNSANPDAFDVRYLNVDDSPLFASFTGKTYLRSGRLITHDPKDLQSFTLIKFMCPELMNYEGRAVLIDPDVFSVHGDINDLLTMDLRGKSLAVRRKKDGFDPSVMLMDCAKLAHWRMGDLLQKFERKEVDYRDVMFLKLENPTTILELPEQWNTYDDFNEQTKLIHTTNRLTQPWKTGLPIDFRREPMKKIGGVIPREWVLKLRGKYPSRYQPHPRPHVERYFFQLAREAFEAGELTCDQIQNAISQQLVRPDFMKKLQDSAINP